MPKASRTDARWLVLIFRLPARQGSVRVEVWRRLKRIGALPLAGSGYVLPAQDDSMEQLQWLASIVRKHAGEVTVVEAATLGAQADQEMGKAFRDRAASAYRKLYRDARRGARLRDPVARRRRLALLRRRFAEAAAIDFFGSPLRAQVEAELDRLEMSMSRSAPSVSATPSIREYKRRTWITRPRPKVDRCASAWLIRRFIDPQAKFVFAAKPDAVPRAVPFDMFDTPAGFGHRGDDCTFETLVRDFKIRDRRVAEIAQVVHDADLGDGKFGRNEASAVAQVLAGWAQTGISDTELLRRGMDLFEGLYRAVPEPRRRMNRP